MNLKHTSNITPGTGVLALSRSYGIMSLNQAAKKLLGCDPELGKSWPLNRMFAATNLAQAQAAVESVFISGQPQDNLQGKMIHADGRSIPCQYSAYPLFKQNREIIGVILSFRGSDTPSETSNHSHVPNRISNIPAFDYRTLVDDLPGGIFTIDTDWRITAFNRAAETITGFNEQEVLGSRCWEIFRSELCRKDCPMHLAFDGTPPRMDRDVSICNSRGKRQTHRVNVGILRDNQGKVCGAVQTFRRTSEGDLATSGRSINFGGIVGNSPAMRSLLNMLPDVAASEANVLICGESGTGKELIARAIHGMSKHCNNPFVAVNCAALPETLLESELFGHEKGAFTGAERAHAGRFEMSGNGTIFLDEIGEFKPDLQVKLLRVLEHRLYERVGGTLPIHFRARIISATNQNLMNFIKKKQFREDLYYRLRTVPLKIPPLRERPEDIPLLVEHFMQKFNTKCGKRVRAVDPKVLQLFMNYDWPGNVRELERCIEHAFVFVKGPVIFQRFLSELFESQPKAKLRRTLPPHGVNPEDKESILWALSQSGGRRQEAADLLGISRTSMWRRMKTFGLV